MTTSKDREAIRATLLLIFIGFIIRVAVSGQFLLVPDETNYWQWSRYLDLGYQDHPPMIAWTIWLSTQLFGQNEIAVRLPTIIGLSVASIYMALLAGRIFSWQTAFHATLLSQGILLFNGAAMIATPDGMLLPCWAGASYHAYRALKENRMQQWLLTGFWFGVGLLSKYTVLLFLPSLLLCIIAAKPFRNRLFQPAPWVGLFLGLLVFTPVILWNINNEWATFRHVLYMSGINESGFFTLKYIVDYVAEQLALLSPVVFVFILIAWVIWTRKNDFLNADIHFLTWTSLPTFLAFLLLSLHSRVYGNWPAAGYLTAIVLITSIYGPTGSLGKKRESRGWKIAVITAYLMTVPVLIQVIYPLVPLPVQYDRTARETIGWDTLGQAVHETVQTMPDKEDVFIFGIRYQIASELAFYMPGRPRTVSINRWTRPNVYDYWFDDSILIGRNGVGVTEHKIYIQLLELVFDDVVIDREVPIYRYSPLLGQELVTTFYIFRSYGFKGGQRWQPIILDDIRATKKQT